MPGRASRRRNLIRNLTLALASVLMCLLAAEVGFRLLDPFPYYSPDQITHTYHGNLSMYDTRLGWRGVPDGAARITTHNNQFGVLHNPSGFRDLAHEDSTDRRPGIAFLGDSFTWGYEVEWEEMFVNILRERLPQYEIYNLAHNGYGTDQSLLTYRYWRTHGDTRLVVLVFTENDVDDNNAARRYFKNKPKFEMLYGQVVLAGVPVEREDAWDAAQRSEDDTETRPSWIRDVAFCSHLLHDMYYRLRGLCGSGETPSPADEAPDLQLTSALLRELNREVQGRGAELLIVFVPSKSEIYELTDTEPYQRAIARLCREHGIGFLDLAPAFHDTWLRTYYRLDMHWNPRGHRVAAAVIAEHLRDL